MGVVAGEDAFKPKYRGAAGVATRVVICPGGVVGRRQTPERELLDALPDMIESRGGPVDALVFP